MEEKELLSFNDGTYVFQETNNLNQFLFYRKDGNKLGQLEREPMDMFQRYVSFKGFSDDKFDKTIIMNNICYKRSCDGKVLCLTTESVYHNDEEVQTSEIVETLKNRKRKTLSKLFKRMFKS